MGQSLATKCMIYFNYENNQVLILDQYSPAVTTAKLYHKGQLKIHELVNKICICRWMKPEELWVSPAK